MYRNKSINEILDFVKNTKKITDYEVYAYTDKTERLHGDYLENIDEIIDIDKNKKFRKLDVFNMNENEYNNTINANSCVKIDFKEIYGNSKAQILVMVMSYEDYRELMK